MLVGVAKALARLHEAGYVYHNIKPSDVAWDADSESWQLLDFSRSVPSGMPMPLMHSSHAFAERRCARSLSHDRAPVCLFIPSKLAIIRLIWRSQEFRAIVSGLGGACRVL